MRLDGIIKNIFIRRYKMVVQETLSSGLKRQYKVKVPRSLVEEKTEKRLQELGNSTKMSGFRPGKVPQNVIKQRYSASVSNEMVSEAVNEAANKIIGDKSLRLAFQPKFEQVTFKEGQDLEFEMNLELLPEIKNTDFKKISVEKLIADVPEETVLKELDGLADRRRETYAVTDSSDAQEGDVLVVDFVGMINGKEFTGGTAKKFTLQLGAKQVLPEFEQNLLGVKVGEERTFMVTFPNNYPSRELIGKQAFFTVKTTELKRLKDKSKVDDEFAKKLGLADLNELKKNVRQQLQASLDRISWLRLKRQILDELDKSNHFELPPTMVEMEFNNIWQEVLARKQNGTVDPEDSQKNDDDLKSEYQTIAERRVKLGLLLSEIGRSNNIQVTNDDLSKAVMNEAGRYPGQEKKVVEYYQKNAQAVAQLRAPIFEDKVVKFIADHIQLTQRRVSAEELQKEV